MEEEEDVHLGASRTFCQTLLAGLPPLNIRMHRGREFRDNIGFDMLVYLLWLRRVERILFSFPHTYSKEPLPLLGDFQSVEMCGNPCHYGAIRAACTTAFILPLLPIMA